MSARLIGHEPTGQELVTTLLTLRDVRAAHSHPGSSVVFAKLYWLHKRRHAFVGSASEDVVLEAWLKAMAALPKFRGSSAGEAVNWLGTIARNVSIDDQRKRQRERRRAAGLARAPEPSVSPSVSMLTADGEAEAEAFLIELRDEHIRAFCEASFPRRGAAREQVELAYLAAMDREEYEKILREAEDEQARQRLQKKMGRGRDELWLPFLASLEREQPLEDLHRVLVRELITALESTRRTDHGRARSAGRGQP